MKSAGTIKKGELLIFTVEIVDTATDLPAIGLASNLECQGRYDPDGLLVTEFSISETEIPGTYLFKSGPSDSWLTGLLLLDIKYNVPESSSIITETFSINVEEGVTK